MFYDKILLYYNPSVSLARATSPIYGVNFYTREAHYRPTVHLKGVIHYTLQGKAFEKEYEQNCPYSFCYFFGRCCPLRVILSGVRPRFHLRFARCCFAVRLRYASLRMTRRTQSKPGGRTVMPFGSRREIKTCFMVGAPLFALFSLAR